MTTPMTTRTPMRARRARTRTRTTRRTTAAEKSTRRSRTSAGRWRRSLGARFAKMLLGRQAEVAGHGGARGGAVREGPLRARRLAAAAPGT